jgi:hypothetical protein
LSTGRVIIRLRNRWLAALSPFAAGVLLLWRGDAFLIGLAVVSLLGSVVALRMRVVADRSGLKVVNLAWPRRVRWEEIRGFSIRGFGWWAAGNDSLEIRLKDGRRVRAWALSTNPSTGYSLWAVEKMLDELRLRLAESNGETTDQADARGLDEALHAAEEGDYVPFWDLVNEDRISPEMLWARVDELAARGRLDRDALERSGPKLSRSLKRYLARKHPEIAAELDEGPR